MRLTTLVRAGGGTGKARCAFFNVAFRNVGRCRGIEAGLEESEEKIEDVNGKRVGHYSCQYAALHVDDTTNRCTTIKVSNQNKRHVKLTPCLSTTLSANKTNMTAVTAHRSATNGVERSSIAWTLPEAFSCQSHP
jgi:hypothetical protein